MLRLKFDYTLKIPDFCAGCGIRKGCAAMPLLKVV